MECLKKNGIAYWTQALAYTMWVLDRSICFQRLEELLQHLLWPLSFMSAFPSKVFYSPNLIKLRGEEEEIRRPPWNVIYMAVLISEKACVRADVITDRVLTEKGTNVPVLVHRASKEDAEAKEELSFSTLAFLLDLIQCILMGRQPKASGG